MAEADGVRSSEDLEPRHQGQSTAEEEQSNVQQTPSAAMAIDAIVSMAGSFQPEDSMVRAPMGMNRTKFLYVVYQPNVQGLLSKVEEIKRLHCAISIAANAALKLSLEVIETVNSLQDSQSSRKG